MKNVKSFQITTLSLAGIALVFGIQARMSYGADSEAFEVHFLSKLHAANQEEIEMGHLAEVNGLSEAVRTFGARLIKDHTEADQKLIKIATENNLTLEQPLQSQSDHEKKEIKKMDQTMTKLKSLKGSNFDQEFRQAMITDHKEDIQEVKKAIPKLKDKNVQQLARNVLPVLEAHERISLKLPAAS